MNYSEWNEHVGFSGWDAPIGTSQWDKDLTPWAEEDEENYAQTLSKYHPECRIKIRMED